jgi:putative ABC transport system permease protein
MLRDIAFALRMLRKNPGFTVIALLAIALGVGANAAIFTVVNAVLIRPLPYEDPDRLMILWEDTTYAGFPRNTPAPANYADWKSQNSVFSHMAALSWATMNITGAGDPEKVEGYKATANLFSVMGVQPLHGRVFTADEDRPGGPKVAVLGYGLWKRRFGADMAVIGKDVLVNDIKHTVVGVMPPGFAFPTADIEMWVPQQFTAEELNRRSSHYLNVVARLKAGVSLEQARTEMNSIAARLEKQYPDTNHRVGAVVLPILENYLGKTRLALQVLLIAVGCVLLIACANIANLLLSRSTARKREMAVRASLGASRRRLVRQSLTESLLLALAGGVAGLLLAAWTLTALRTLVPEHLAPAITLSLDIRVLVFTFLVTALTGVLFGLAPALQSARVDLNETLKQGGGRITSAGGSFRRALVAGEVAVALVLVIGAGLMIKSIANLYGVDLGFRPENILTMRLNVSRTKYPKPEQRAALFDRVIGRLRTLPGVDSAGFTSALPLTWKGGSSSFWPEAHTPIPGLPYDANNRVVSPDYMRVVGMTMLQGRHFDESDGPDARKVAIINESMAKMYWPGQSATGYRFKRGAPDSDAPWVTIAGVVKDIRQMGIDVPGRPEMYFPYKQAYDNWMLPRDIVLKISGDHTAIAAAARRMVWEVEANQPVSNIAMFTELIDAQLAERRVHTTVLATFAGIALLLACLGIYGVLAYLVGQRTPDIGVRLALGAKPSDILRDVLAGGLKLAFLGVLIGLIAASAVVRLLDALLFGVSGLDPVIFAAVPVLLLAVALAAAYFPARRAMRVDPITALRYE